MESSIWSLCSKEKGREGGKNRGQEGVRPWAKVPIGGARGSAGGGRWVLDGSQFGGWRRRAWNKRRQCSSEVRGPVLAKAILVLKPRPAETKRRADQVASGHMQC